MNLVDDPEFPHAGVTVETRTGHGPRGDQFASPVTRTVIVEDGRQLVRDATGEQVVSETTLYDRLDAASLYAVGSKVAVGNRTARVIVAKRRERDDDVEHVEVALT